jgi:beta-glucosidase
MRRVEPFHFRSKDRVLFTTGNFMFARRRLTHASVLALLMAGSLSGATLAQTPSAVAHPELWPKAASPAAITDAKTEAFITS